MIQGITRYGYPNTLVSSNYLAGSDRALCNGCGVCLRKCPIQAIRGKADPEDRFKKFGRPEVDESLCLGCGVCAVQCRTGAMKLHPRARRVWYPENTFERLLLMSLERGTLQNQLFSDPHSKTQAFLRGILGGFLRLAPVKQALMGDTLRSRFLHAMREGARRQSGMDPARF